MHYFRMQQKGHARASRREIMLNKTTSLVLMPQLEEDLQVRVKFVTIKPDYREDLRFIFVGDILNDVFTCARQNSFTCSVVE